MKHMSRQSDAQIQRKSSVPGGHSPSSPLPRILQLQKAIGNRAVMQLISKQQPPIQMKKISAAVAETYSDVLLDLIEEIENNEGQTALHSALYDFYNALDSDMEERAFSDWVQEILHNYPIATNPVLVQLGGVGQLTHPSGIADARGVLSPTITKIRQHMYPSSYVTAAKQANALKRNARAVVQGVTWRCPSCNQDRAWNDATIDHIVPVAQHWNAHGHDQTRQDRHDWFNDTNNHQCMCQSCNSSFGSGGVYYSRIVGPNFMN